MRLNNRLKDNRGFALIITIMIFSLIVPLTLQFNNSTIFYKVSAANLEDGAKAICAVKSGFEYALAVLFGDASLTEFDSLHEEWANQETLNATAASLFEDVKLEIVIIDASGKFNINRLIRKNKDKDVTKFEFDEAQKSILKRLIESIGFDLEEDEIGNILNSIKDWIDPDDDVTEEEGFGAENTYYMGLSEPYACRNAPLKTLDELRLIKGMTNEIYSEISKHLTLQGKGNININTASKTIIESLSDDIGDEIAQEIIDYRNEEKNDLSTISWYKSVHGIGDINIDDLVTISSTHFEIISTGFKGSIGKKVRGTVERGEQGKLSVLSWQIE